MKTRLIAKKIKADLRDGRDNITRMRGLTAYCAAPENKDKKEKCILKKIYGFSDDNLDEININEEFEYDMSLTKRSDVEKITHWTISFDGEKPSPDEIVDAARELAKALGHTDSNKMLIAVHDDTEHRHAHIVACRVNPETGKLVREGGGWWKKESQRALAKIASKHGWELPEGAMFDAEGTQLREKTRPELSFAAGRFEAHTGLKSDQRTLQEIMLNWHAAHEKEMASWKWADFHASLAALGIECQRREHGPKKFGLVFSDDGQNFQSASDVCPELTYKKAVDALGGKSWRAAREGVRETLEAARAARVQVQQEAVKMPEYTKAQKEALRRIPLDQVWQALGRAPIEKLANGRQIKNAFDATTAAGMPYHDALVFLAERFPAALGRAGQIEMAQAAVSSVQDTLDRRDRSRAEDIALFMSALHVERLEVETALSQGARDRGFHAFTGEVDYASLCDKLPLLAAMSSAGTPVTDKTGIFCRPLWPDGRVGFIVDDVKPGFAEKFPPSVLLATSDHSRQAIYSLPRRYEPAFYEFAARHINARHGDPAVKSTAHPTRLPGFENQKRQPPSVCRVESTNADISKMEQALDVLYEKVWPKEKARLEAMATAAQQARAWQEEAQREPEKKSLSGLFPEQRPADPVVKKRQHTEDELPDWLRDTTEQAKPRRVEVPADLERFALAQQAAIAAKYASDLDRSRVDSMTAMRMYRRGATVDQVYSWMLEHLMQAKGQSRTGNTLPAREIDRAAERVAMNIHARYEAEQTAAQMAAEMAAEKSNDERQRWREEKVVKARATARRRHRDGGAKHQQAAAHH